MQQIEWDDVKKGQYLIIRQNVPMSGPRKHYEVEWCGVVTEHSPKWTKLKHAGQEMSVPQKWGDEEILKCDKKEFDTYIKETYS